MTEAILVCGDVSMRSGCLMVSAAKQPSPLRSSNFLATIFSLHLPVMQQELRDGFLLYMSLAERAMEASEGYAGLSFYMVKTVTRS